jgi:phosphate transport system permease protein
LIQVDDRRRDTGDKTLDDRLSVWGSLVGSFAIVWLCYFQLLPFSGILGFLVCWYVTFLLLYAAVSAESNPRPIVVDRVMAATITGAAAVVGFALAVTVCYTFFRGWGPLHHWNFFFEDSSRIGPTAPFSQGGIFHAIAGSAIELGIATSVALPLGLGTAVYMSEVGGSFSRVVRTVVESMTALPDILAGLFIYTVLILTLGYDRSGLAAGLALAIMMLPIIARSADVILRIVPGGLREASLALGASQWRTVWSVVLPTARSGLATALILGLARAVGETAPVIITSGASNYLNTNPLKHQMNSLPLYILTGERSGQTNAVARAFGAAAVLLGLVIVLFVVTRVLARDRKGSR